LLQLFIILPSERHLPYRVCLI